MGFAGLLNQTVAINNLGGTRDLHGKVALNTSFSSRARLERTYKTIVTADNEKTPIHAVVFVPPTVMVGVGDKVTYGDEVYRVMTKSDMVGRNGSIYHKELLLQLWSFSS